MKKSQEKMMVIRLNPDESRKLAAEKTAELSDDQAAIRAEKIVSALKPLMDHVQKKFFDGASAEHQKSAEKALFDRCAGLVIADLEQALEDITLLAKKKLVSYRVPDRASFDALSGLLSASVLLLYPCMQLSETRTNREFVFYGERLLKKIKANADKSKGAISKEIADEMRILARDDIYAMRNSTAEYTAQTKIFSLLRDICLAMGRKLKLMKAHDTAIEALALKTILDRRSESYKECLDEKTATEFSERFRALFDRFHLELIYNEL